MLLSTFNGGLNTRVVPHLINVNESTICNNVDLSSGIIKPLKGLSATNKTIPLNNNSFIEFKGTYLSGPSGTSYVEFNDKLYIADGTNTIKKTSDGINLYELGINAPSTKLVTSTSFSISFTLANITSGSDITFTQGTYNYLIQYETTAGSINYEEKSFTYSGTKGIRLTISSMSDIKSVTLYRKVDTKYRLVGETTSTTIIDDIVFDISAKTYNTPYQQLLGTRNYVYTYYSSTTGFESAPSEASDDLVCNINNVVITNFTTTSDTTVDSIRLYRIGGTLKDYYLVATFSKTTTSYTDTKTDLQALDGTLLTTSGLIKPKTGLKFLTEYNAALFGAIDSIVYFSNVGLVDQWAEYNYIEMPEHITGFGVTQNGLLIFSRNKTWILTGNSLSTYSKYLLNGNQGCVSHNTIAYVANNLLWYSLDGICTSTGSNIELLSWPKLGKLVINPICAKVYENQYYLFHETGTLLVDFREGVRFSTLSLIVRGAYYNPSYDILYILQPNNIGMFEYGTGSDLTLNYKTGRLSEGKISNYKSYKNLYIYSKGAGQVKLYMDGELISTINLVDGFNDIKYLQTSTRGYYIELEFTGTNSILEVDYAVEGRQNGR